MPIKENNISDFIKAKIALHKHLLERVIQSPSFISKREKDLFYLLNDDPEVMNNFYK